MTDPASRTPSEIDAELDTLYQQEAMARSRRNSALASQSRALKAENYSDAERMQRYVDEAQESIETLTGQMDPLEVEYARRPWTRFYLVTNSNGHVHHTTACSTCFDNTRFAWLTQFSGTSHEDLVELAGEKACTVCFPDAPVDVLKRASKLTTPEREAKAAEQAQKAAEKAASQVVVNHYRDGSRTSTKVFKTVRGATNEIASTLASMVGYGPSHPDFNEWRGNVEEIIEALMDKGEIEDGLAYYSEALAKARKKCITDHKKFMRDFGDYYRNMGTLDPAVDQPGYTPVKY